jgi:hypothetical protein
MTNPLQFTTGPVDWTQPVQCSFRQASDVLRLAEAKGFKPDRIQCVNGGYIFTFHPSATNDAARGEHDATAGIVKAEGRQTSLDTLTLKKISSGDQRLTQKSQTSNFEKSGNAK